MRTSDPDLAERLNNVWNHRPRWMRKPSKGAAALPRLRATPSRRIIILYSVVVYVLRFTTPLLHSGFQVGEVAQLPGDPGQLVASDKDSGWRGCPNRGCPV